MTDYERELAELIDNVYDEDEDAYPYYDRRVYLDLNGVVSSKGEMSDILFIHHTINLDKKTGYLQLFLSSPDDMCQDFIYIDDLTDEERKAIEPMIMEQLLAR